jgi:hypothetical protein
VYFFGLSASATYCLLARAQLYHWVREHATYLSAFKYATLFYKMSKQMYLYDINSSQKRLSHKSDPFVTGRPWALPFGIDLFWNIRRVSRKYGKYIIQAVCRGVVGVIKPSMVLDVNRVILHSRFPLQDTHSPVCSFMCSSDAYFFIGTFSSIASRRNFSGLVGAKGILIILPWQQFAWITCQRLTGA